MTAYLRDKQWNSDKITYMKGQFTMKEKVVLAYSGGLDTTAIIPWLKETYDYEVVLERKGWRAKEHLA